MGENDKIHHMSSHRTNRNVFKKLWRALKGKQSRTMRSLLDGGTRETKRCLAQPPYFGSILSPPLKKCITFLCICVKGEMHSYLQVWHQVLLPTVPSCWPCYFLLHVLSQLSTPGMVPTLLAFSVKVQDSKATLSFMWRVLHWDICSLITHQDPVAPTSLTE